MSPGKQYKIHKPRLDPKDYDGELPCGIQEVDCWRAINCHESGQCHACIFSENNLEDYNRWLVALHEEQEYDEGI